MNSYEEIVATITKGLVDEGKILEAGFDVLCQIMIPPDAPQEQTVDKNSQKKRPGDD